MESSGCYTSLRENWFHIQAPVGISVPHLHRWKYPKPQRRWLFCTTPYLVIVVWNSHRGLPSRKFHIFCSMLHFSIHWKDENGCFVIRWSHQDREGKQKERKRENQLAEKPKDGWVPDRKKKKRKPLQWEREGWELRELKNWVSALKLIPNTLRRNNDRKKYPCNLELLVLSVIGSFGSFDSVSVLGLWKSRSSLRTHGMISPLPSQQDTVMQWCTWLWDSHVPVTFQHVPSSKWHVTRVPVRNSNKLIWTNWFTKTGLGGVLFWLLVFFFGFLRHGFPA